MLSEAAPIQNMTTQQIAATELVDGIPALKLLEGLARLHQLVLVTDAEDRILWMSDELGLFCGGLEHHLGGTGRGLVPRLPLPEQARELQTRFRERGFVANQRMEIRGLRDDVMSAEVSVLPVSTSDGTPLFVSIARPVGGAATVSRLPNDFLETVPDAVVAIDERGFVSFVNASAERMVGRSRGELLHKPIGVLLASSAALERLVSQLSPARPIQDQDLEVRRSDGTLVGVSMAASALRGDGDEPAGSVLFLRDQQRRREDRTDLERRNAELEHCVHTVSHDLRSPLVALLGFSRLLRQDYGERLDETAIHFLDRIEQAGRTMESLVHDLLELSRIGRPGERRMLVDPRSVLLQLHAELKGRLETESVRLELPAEAPTIYCDRTRLYQLFSNLIGNALDHMGPCEDGWIRVEIQDEESWHHIVVRDSGRGIAPEHHERIFEIFRSLSPPRDGSRGTGIGLAIVKKVAETHGGRVWVESRVGEGATFHVVLPRA